MADDLVPCLRTEATEDFVQKARVIHGDKYDYSKTVYVNARTLIEVICPIHGSFLQRVPSHLKGSGCRACAGKGRGIKISTEAWIEKARRVHGDKYDYSQVEYVN